MIVNAYLMFDGQCEEAFRFYERCLGGKLEMVLRYADMPECVGMDEATGKKIAHVRLAVDGCLLMGSDAGDPTQKWEGHKGFFVCINTKDPAQAEQIFNALSDQARAIMMPLAKTSWSEKYGQLADRYGVEWMVNCDTHD